MTETNQDINKYLAEVTGEWKHDKHEMSGKEFDMSLRPIYKCICNYSTWSSDHFSKHIKKNPNYFTPSGCKKLIDWISQRDDYWKFIDWLMGKLDVVHYTSHRMITAKVLHLFRDTKLFPTLCAEWMKGEEREA